jgi:hypothetical protein
MQKGLKSCPLPNMDPIQKGIDATHADTKLLTTDSLSASHNVHKNLNPLPCNPESDLSLFSSTIELKNLNSCLIKLY